LARGLLRGDLRSVGGALARALEVARASAAPGEHVAVRIRQRDDRVVERALHVRASARHTLTLTPSPRPRFPPLLPFSHRSLRSLTSSPSSAACRQRYGAGRAWCARSSWCADRARAGCGDGGSPCSS